MPITRTPIHDDDGSGTTGTILDNAWKQELYDQIDAADRAGVTTLFRTIGGTKNGAADVYLDTATIPALAAGATIRIGIVGYTNPRPQTFGLENLNSGVIVDLLPLLPSAGTFAIDALIQSLSGATVQAIASGYNVGGVITGSAGALNTAWTTGWPMGLRWNGAAGSTINWRWSIAILSPPAGSSFAADERDA